MALFVELCCQPAESTTIPTPHSPDNNTLHTEPRAARLLETMMFAAARASVCNVLLSGEWGCWNGCEFGWLTAKLNKQSHRWLVYKLYMIVESTMQNAANENPKPVNDFALHPVFKICASPITTDIGMKSKTKVGPTQVAG